jgi:voltage-gated potassium channel
MLIVFVITVGTVGYMLLEDWGLFDSLYMTVITITTIGFKEVHKMTEPGRVFTVILIFTSVGAVFYSLNNAARILIEGELKDVFGRRRLRKMIKKLKGHYIVCGYGRMGKIICNELNKKGTKYIAIENSPEPEAAEEMESLMLYGNATKDEVLKKAGIERAKGLISVLPSDAENLYVVLSARGMNPSLNIVARAVEDGSEQKLMRAGADRVVSPYHIGGLRIAHSVLKPAVVDLIEFSTHQGEMDLQMEEIRVQEGSDISGKTLSQCEIGKELGIIVIAVKKTDDTMMFNPTHNTEIVAGNKLLVIGESEKFKILERLAGVG